jgi:hypothetical protein
LLKIKLCKCQKAAVGQIDFRQKVVAATVIEIHLHVVVPHTEPKVFEGMPFNGSQNID